jgi:hypothetical protein
MKTNIIVAKNNLDIIEHLPNAIDFTIYLDNNFLMAVSNNVEPSNQNVQSGFCNYCKKFIENFLYNHENIYCKNNLNKNEEKVAQFKLNEKERLGRKVKCCCEETIAYSSLSKHRLTKKHINKVGNNNIYYPTTK